WTRRENRCSYHRAVLKANIDSTLNLVVTQVADEVHHRHPAGRCDGRGHIGGQAVARCEGHPRRGRSRIIGERDRARAIRAHDPGPFHRPANLPVPGARISLHWSWLRRVETALIRRAAITLLRGPERTSQLRVPAVECGAKLSHLLGMARREVLLLADV